MALSHVLIGFFAPFFDMSLFFEVFQDIVINWNLTPIKGLGTFVAMQYSSSPVPITGVGHDDGCRNQFSENPGLVRQRA
jgi:hypothetical protein